MYKQYEHHGNLVWVREDLLGAHREHCLCFSCTRLNIEDRKKNCKIANDLYKLCVKHSLTTPVFECPDFNAKYELSGFAKIWWAVKKFFRNLYRSLFV